MDTRLLRHYENELAFMRDMGAEFATAYPKIASRLGMDGVEVLDPYVERILEGAAFLSARVQLELEQQYPALTSHLLEIVYPHYLAPTPSMMIAAFEPDHENAAWVEGHLLPRQTTLRSRLGEGEQTACVFRTAADVTLWPIRISEAEYIDGRGALAAAGVSTAQGSRAAIRLRLERHNNLPIADLPLNNLTIFLGGTETAGWGLHALLSTQTKSLVARSTDRRADWTTPLVDGAVVPRGYGREEALLPLPRQSFDGYRLLQEYFALPERFHFVELTGLGPGISRASGKDVDIYILLGEGDEAVAPSVAPEVFVLNAVPAINLFPKRCDRILVSGHDTEMHVIGDRTAPMDYEVFGITSVNGISGEGQDDTSFRPFYSADDFTAAGESYPAYYTLRRRMRQRSERERLKGSRTSYLGSETYLTLVDPNEAPFRGDLRQLAVQAMVTNRDLPLLLATGTPDLFHLPDGGPVKRITTPLPPTRPRPTLAQSGASWRLISHLSLNYLSIADEGEERGAAALRELLGIYAPAGDKVIEKQLEGISKVETRSIVRRMADGVMSTAIRGLEIRITLDESFYEGTSPYLVGAVLERFFRKYVTINSFTETVLITEQSGEIARWRPQTGLGRII